MEIKLTGKVTSVSRKAEHALSKEVVDVIHLLEGLGVEGDAHQGRTVQHRSRVAADPSQPNLRQVHLIHSELFAELEELAEAGFEISAAQMGENITTSGLALLELPASSELHIGSTVILRVTGLRNPCQQLEGIAAGLMGALLGRDAGGKLIRKAGVMATVLRGGEVRAGDPILVKLPDPPFVDLDRV